MTKISDVSLGLPEDIDADPDAIESGAEELDRIHRTMLGQSEDTYGQYRASAQEFTDLLAWEITSTASVEVTAWQEASEALTFGAAVMRQWASDIEDYRAARAELVERWNTAKSSMETMLESVNVTPGVPPPPISIPGQRALTFLFSGGVAAQLAKDHLLEPKLVSALEDVRADLLSEHSGHWETLMDQADQAESDLRKGPDDASLERLVGAGYLNAGQLALYGAIPAGMVPEGPDEVPSDMPPALVNLWWSSLTEDEQQEAMELHPDELRELDGIPAVVRDELNREHLDDEIERMTQEAEELRKEVDRLEEELMDDTSPPIDGPLITASVDLVDLENQLDVLNELQGRLDGTSGHELPEGLGHEDLYLLSLDTENEGRAIVTHGNPDTADNIATSVPGTTTDWTSINGQMGRSGDLYRAAAETDPDAEHAVITWIGYDAPAIHEAAGPTKAENAVEELSDFQKGLRATHEGAQPSHNTVIGHSYGSTVVGHTAMSEEGLDADDLVFVGSPGVGAEHVTELGFAPENVHASTALNDGISPVISGLAPFGLSPNDPSFGATEFESAEGSRGWPPPLGPAHSEYFDPETPSLEYMGEVIAGGR